MSLEERSDLVLSFAKVLHENGQTTGETVQATERLGKNLGLEAIVIPGWRDLQVQSTDGADKTLSIGVASPTGVDMDRVSSAMKAIDNIGAQRMALPSTKETISTISRTPPAPTWLFAIGAAAGAASLSIIFGVEHPISVLLIMASAAAGALLRRLIGRYSNNPFVQPFCAALLAGIVGALAVQYNLSSSLRLIAVCPCLVLIPGPHLLNGMIDLLQARINLAISRLVYASFIILAIAAGLLLTFGLFHVLLPVDEPGRVVPLLVDVGAAGVAAAAYSIFYSTPWRMIAWPVAIGMIAHAIKYETQAAGGSVVLASFAACLVAGLILAPIARRSSMPFAAIGFASVVSMLPGVYLLRMTSGLLQLINSSSTSLQLLTTTLSDGVTAFAVFLAIGFGLIVPKIVVDHYVAPR